MVSNIKLNLDSRWKLTKLYYGRNSEKGTFFAYDKDSGVISNIKNCRVEFSWHFSDDKFVGFGCEGLSLNKFNQFWEILEKKLKLKDKTIIHETNEERIIVLELSDFWLKNEARRQFLTLMIRCGAVHYRNSFDDAIKDYDLTSRAEEAVYWFLEGNTVQTFDKFTTKDIEGWPGFVAEFENASPEYLKKALVQEK